MSKKYLPDTLTKEDKAKQKKSIEEGTDRPQVDSYKSKRSRFVVAFEKKYGTVITDDEYIAEHIISKEGIKQILAKGMAAYYTSGSRPNQTKESWARARLASVIMNGKARNIDRKIWEKYKKDT